MLSYYGFVEYSLLSGGKNRDNVNKNQPIMQRSLMTLPSLNRFLIGARIKFIPVSVHAANITSIKLNKEIPPKQPVPELKNTIKRYLKSLEPLLCDKEYCETEKIVKEFEKGVGAELHRKLLERYESTENWMNEWFLHAAYLGYRIPLIVHSSPGTVGPLQKFSCPDEVFIFGGKLIAAVCEYDSMIKSGKMKQEMAGKDPLDMQPYAMILGTYRRPDIPLDCQLHTDTSDHIIVIHNNHIFKLNIFDESGKNRTPLSEGQLAASLKDIAGRSAVAGTPIGILTGNDRDTWAKDYKKLEACGSNRKILEDIENAMFVLCLDKAMGKDISREKNYESFRAVQSLTGVTCETNAGNRWHDKAVQFIVSYDGFVGMTYEHSPCEGVPIAVLHDHVLKYIANKKDNKCDQPKEFPKAQLMKFYLPEGIEKSISAATSTVEEISKDIDMECFTFENFGTEMIKKNKMSPDSFIQMAMQLAYYRIHGKPPAHYESAGLRRFRNSRTECIRSTSVESVQFAQAVISGNTSKLQKKEAMMKAINAHKKLAGEAATGQGVDRHLFGLKTIATKEGSTLPQIFTDVGYKRSTHFTLTSSQVPYKTASFMCYGPVTPDGYGCCYNPRPQDIRVACSSFNACKETCTKKFAEALQQSFCDMIELATEC
ncbi:carnitine O-acetyltransferase-like isoform X1 [Neodiprion virginianus]|uniref:carnitine O-acetyltransferase-like isoform X1 n=2 Tax=Neodiprion virginianus TaxID=2961670 RepID=UPI001EE777FE|nr:carnitine O-acetyltransferase-like isoform X1 [Neodiprion virginianus]